jgi:hypothetical protein
VAFILKIAQHVEDYEVTDVEVGRGRVETQLDAQPIAALEPSSQVIRDVDLDGPLA